MTNTTQGFTLIELLIVIAIIGILAAVLIPNLLNAQKKGYDAGAISCGKSVQTAEALSYTDISKYVAISKAMSGINAGCADTNINLTQVSQADDNYSFTVGDKRGSRTYTYTPSSMTSAAGAPAAGN